MSHPLIAGWLFLFLNPAIIIKKDMVLKTNLHFHVSLDESPIIDYDIHQYIDFAKEKDFDVLAYTPHRKFLFRPEYADYAARKNILLIPGMEIEIDGKHIVLVNCGKEAEKIKTFEDLGAYKQKNPQVFVIAPHPYVLSPKSLRSKLSENITLFDTLELTVFSNKIFDFNKKAAEIAEKYNKPLIANSDTHFLKDLNRGYSLVEAEKKTIESVLSAIKEKKFQNKMDSMDILAMLEFQFKLRIYSLFHPTYRSK